MDPAPARLGRYTILEEIGRGGMGCVYKARDEELRRIVALKVLLHRVEDEDRARFLRVAQAAAGLQHPRIITVYDLGEDRGRPYFVMDWIEGESLHDAVDAESLTRREAVEGVAHAYANGILHRDIKPANILVTRRKEAVVLDFGLSLVEGADRLTRSGAALGTPSFMSPEQILGRAEPRSDVWGLGATLYYAISGIVPFKGLTPDLTFDQVLASDPPPPRRVEPTVHPDLETICLKALEKDPARRYASAREFADDLRRHLSDEPIVAKPPSVAYRLRRWTRRRAALLAAIGLAVSLAAGVGTFLTLRARSLAFAEAKEEARRAFAVGDWARALVECERGSRIRRDAEPDRMAGESRSRLEIRERVKPLEFLMRETRPCFYVPGTDIVARLEKVRADLRELESRLRRPAYARVPEGWLALGIGAFFVGDMRRAERGLAEAEALGADSPWLGYYLGRIYRHLGRTAEADADFRRALELAPKDWPHRKELQQN